MIRGIVKGDPLFRGNLPSGRHLDSQHEDMVPSLGPAVAALALFVDAEVLGDLIGLVRDSLALAFGQRVESAANGRLSPPATKNKPWLSALSRSTFDICERSAFMRVIGTTASSFAMAKLLLRKVTTHT